MKVVPNTNVFFSGVFFSGPPNRILQAWRNEQIELTISPDILAEHRRVGEILAVDHTRLDLI